MTISETEPAAVVVRRLRDQFDSGVTKPLSWRLAQLDGLSAMLRGHARDLEEALAADLGKSPTESRLTETGVLLEEIRHTRTHLRSWLAPRRVSVPWQYQPARASVVLEPLGVMLVMAPWNYPVFLLLGPLVGALAAGNTAVLKPSELAPRTAEVLARLVPRYVDGVEVLTGGVERSTELLRERYDHIVYTGGGRVARIVMTAAAQHLTPVTLELGGKSPAWVDGTTDLQAAARRIAWSKLVNAGQTCVAPDYLLAPPDVARALEPLLSRAVTRMYGSDPARSADYGRMVSTEHAARLERLVADSVAAGARVVVGGEADVAERYVAPTVLADVAPDSPVMAEEIFGPVLPIVPVADLDAAIRLVRAGEKPLALYAFTTDSGARERLLRETSSGGVGFDMPLVQASMPTLPFGGVGGSGMGSYHGEASVRAFSNAKPVVRKPLLPDTFAAIRPPFTGLRRALVRRLF
ncbi:aldehyde dehydrogenase family protein [Georgenia sp. H159]|uniref:aldehyde dehydrogenase family protein n=1 Tax=Georgenia sp. H159 TaxID=3076115 RepID=UPI002D76E31E|nr:aldehyde dehydrogenase family protein [Georgenia sp. H159]